MKDPKSPATTTPALPARKQVLGRGLSALLGEMEREVPIPNQQPASGNQGNDGLRNNMVASMAAGGAADNRKYREVAVASITPNPKQPRKNFNSDKLQELVESLKLRGVIQPLLVRPHPNNAEAYELVAGERRWRAAQLAGLHLVPVIVKDLDNAQTLELSLIENLHRDDLNAIETAEAFQRLIDEFNHSHESLSKILGRSRSALTNDLRLLALPREVKELIKIGQLSAAHGRNLVGVDNAEGLARQVMAEQWSVRRLEQEVKHWKGNSEQTASGKDNGKSATGRDPNLGDIENRLTKILGLRVMIKTKGGSKSGSMTIEFKDGGQLQKIIQLLTKK
ncbi:MAG: ParB/RepB/Spo0J family partition protein [Hydrotalea sp.]|nr:ParB/RepB/Spo0J family partition protein [Hydrotalea sp.]